MDPGELTSAGPAAFRVMRANRYNPARRRWRMLRTLLRRMNILSFWAHFTAFGTAWADAYTSRGSRYERHLRVSDMLDISGGATDIRGRETTNLRPVRGAPPIGRGYARYQPLP